MLKSKARRRIATKAAAAGVVSAGILLGGVPAIAALVSTDVTYTCTSSGTPTETATYTFKVELVTPVPSVTQGATATVTWNITQPPAVPLPALSRLPASASNKIVLEGDLIVSGTPIAVQSTVKKASGSVAPTTEVATDSAVPLPTMLATLVPTATGAVGMRPDKFLVKVVPTAATSPIGTWYTCTPQSTAEAAAAAITFSVASSTASSTSTTTPTVTPTVTPTPKNTKTVFKTVTAKPKKSPTEQVTKKPDGGAATGGGGDAGPDGRAFVVVGSILVFGAGIGGLMMRRRRPQRG